MSTTDTAMLIAIVNEDGSAAVVAGDVLTEFDTATVEDGRHAIMMHAIAAAQERDAAVRLHVTEPDGTWPLIVNADGDVQPDEDGEAAEASDSPEPGAADDSAPREEAAAGDDAGIQLDRLIADADLVITAEGAIDLQTPHGKVPAEVARRAKRAGAPVLAMAGSLGEGAADVHDIGIDAIASIISVPMRLEDAVDRGAQLLADATARTVRIMALGASMSDSIRRRDAA